MTLVYGCIAPHGGEVIPALAGDKARLFAETRRGMRELAERMKRARPSTIVLASPHNLRLLKHIGVVVSENTSGEVREGEARVALKAKCDVELGLKVIEEGERAGLPVVGANYGGLEGPLSNLAMDWGTLIPLWFFMRGARPKPRVLVVTPSRGISLRLNFQFGAALARVVQKSRGRVAFVASADQAHAHSKDGPYGFSERAAEYDALVVDLVKRNRLGDLLKIPASLVEEAKPDSLWQMAMLAGAQSVVPMVGELISYQVPSYFGLLCATYSPT
ncbi:MAG: extradiol ring-cleavage dioxygenase [archaeon]|nr:MAG: extradiol ring-cleavage dioxygenase [archaeon]